MRTGWLCLATILCLTLAARPMRAVGSATHEAPADVNAAVRAALPQGKGSLTKIAPTAAAYMERCHGSLAVFIMGHGTYRTAEVVCPSPRWTIYVGVSLERTEDVLVATRRVPIGQRLARGDFRVIPMASSNVPGEPISARDVIGKEAAVPLAPGQTITRNQIVIPPAIRNGDKVLIHWVGAGVAATTTGTALESGGPGQSILVESDDSHRAIGVTVVTDDSSAKLGQAFIVAPR